MRTRRVVAFTVLLVVALAVTVGTAGIGQSTPEHRDILINRTKAIAESGPLEGDRLMIWGAGTFSTPVGVGDVAPPSIRGHFVHRHANGKLVAQGFWKATEVISFTSYGTIPDTPLEGGELVLEVTFFVGNEPVLTVDDFIVICLVGTPPAGVHEGVEVPSLGFTMAVEEEHRFTLFFQI